MIEEEFKEHLNQGLDYTANFLECNIFNFTPEEEIIILPILEQYILINNFYSLNPFLAYLYYSQNDIHMAYYFSKEECGIEYENIRVLYNVLSLAKLGYSKMFFSVINELQYGSIISDTRIPVYDRLILAFVLKKTIKLENCKDEYTSKLYELVTIQNDLLSCKREPNQRGKLEKLALYFDDLFIKTNIKLLVGHYFDHEVYKEIPEDLLHKFCNKEVFDNYLDENFDVLKYCTFNAPDISNAHYKDFESKYYKILSYSNEIGFSFHALVTENFILLVDCGAKLVNDESIYIDYDAFFETNELDKSKIIGLVITHAHYDHVGGYNELVKCLGFRPRVFLTKETFYLAEQVNNISFENYEFIEVNNKKKLNEEIKFEFILNGHILGSIAIMVDCLGYKILFTGDYCLHNQNHIDGFDLSYVKRKYKNIDLIVTESTYGNRKYEIEYCDNIVILKKIIEMLHKYGYIIFFPAFAIGRSQELLSYIKNANLRKISILGMAFPICKYYQEVTGKQLLSSGINLTNDKNIGDIVNTSNVILASSGMLLANTNSYKCYNELIDSNLKVALVKTGYLDEMSNGAFLLDKWENEGKPLFEVSLSAHASYYELLTTINYLNPKDVLFVHGNGIK